jgi:DNA repair protein RecN (Recombination protein N)
MLLRLSISNFAIIKKMIFEPQSGLNIITGETGAGKSIILDALNLILGSRADIKTQSEWGEKCIVEGEFALDFKQYKSVFSELDIDFVDVCIIRREINTNGKTRTFINDTPVSLQQLRFLSSSLVSIHSQHENTQLNDKYFQFDLLDSFAKINNDVNKYQSGFVLFRKNQNEIQQLSSQQNALLKEKDYLQFLLNEFELAALQENEEELLENELLILNNAEQVSQVTSQLINTVSDSEQSIVDTLNQIKSKFKAIENVHASASDIYARLQSSIIELKDIASEAASLNELVQGDPKRIEVINERLNLIQTLKRKHAANDFKDLFIINESIADQLFNIGNIDQKLEVLNEENAKLFTKLKVEAQSIHKSRLKSSIVLKSNIETILHGLEMPNAQIEFDLQESNELNEFGCSDLFLKFTANLGMPLQSLNKVASGGELSRLALSIRSIEAKHKQLNTLVFDEIDTGVSGKVADTIGQVFRQISSGHQIIAITHLPQVAGYGDAHFMVCKKEEANTTVSYLKELNPNERVEELAKMLSGNEATEIAKQNALELLKV